MALDLQFMVILSIHKCSFNPTYIYSEFPIQFLIFLWKFFTAFDLYLTGFWPNLTKDLTLPKLSKTKISIELCFILHEIGSGFFLKISSHKTCFPFLTKVCVSIKRTQRNVSYNCHLKKNVADKLLLKNVFCGRRFSKERIFGRDPDPLKN